MTDNIRGTPNNLFIEDAIHETTTSTSTDLGGVRALHGRRREHGHEVRRQHVLGLLPHDVHERRVVRDDARERTSRRRTSTRSTRRRSAGPLEGPRLVLRRRPLLRPDLDGTASFTGHLVPASETPRSATRASSRSRRSRTTRSRATTSRWTRSRRTTSFGTIMDLLSLCGRAAPAGASSRSTTTASSRLVLRRGPSTRSASSSSRIRLAVQGPDPGHPHARPVDAAAPGTTRRRSAACATPSRATTATILVKGTWFLSTRRARLAQHRRSGYDNFTGPRSRTTTSPEATTASSRRPTISQNNDIYPVMDSNSYVSSIYADHEPQQGHRRADALGLRQRLVAPERPPVGEPRRALGQEPRQGQRRGRFGRTTARSARVSRPRTTSPARARSAFGASYAKYVGAIQDSLVDSRAPTGARRRPSSGTTRAPTRHPST